MCSASYPKLKILSFLIALFITLSLLTSSCKNTSEPNKTTNQIKQSNQLLNYTKSLSSLIRVPINKKNISVSVSKSKYMLTLKYKNIAIKQYPIVLGRDPINDKVKEGDKRTPEGIFKIKMLYPHKSWSKFLWIDYPNKNSWKKHNKAKEKGLIDQNSSIGGEVGIHGTPEGDDYLIKEGVNWTAGCISLKRKDVDEIYNYCTVGTPVTISH